MQIYSVQNKNDTTDLNVLNQNTEKNDASFSSVLESQSSETTLENIFKKASDTYGVSVSLLEAVAKQESGFNPTATSRCGAQGIMQLMPSTAAGLGVTDSYNPEQNIMGGAKYLSQLLTTYDGDTTLALAAYNAGSNNVAKYGGVPPFAETQNYVVKVTGYMQNGVTLPDGTVTVGSAGSPASSGTASTYDNEELANYVSSGDASAISDTLASLFSYDDYLKFLDTFLDDYLGVTADMVNPNEASKDEDDETSSYYAYQQTQYNPTIANLLNSSKSELI